MYVVLIMLFQKIDTIILLYLVLPLFCFVLFFVFVFFTNKLDQMFYVIVTILSFFCSPLHHLLLVSVIGIVFKRIVIRYSIGTDLKYEEDSIKYKKKKKNVTLNFFFLFFFGFFLQMLKR